MKFQPVWIVKHALTIGILKYDHSEYTEDGYVQVEDKNGKQIFKSNECFKSEEEALIEAEKMRLEKLRYLYGQIHNLTDDWVQVVNYI